MKKVLKISKKEKLVRHEALIEKSVKAWVVSQSKRSGFSQATITEAALRSYRDSFKDGNI